MVEKVDIVLKGMIHRYIGLYECEFKDKNDVDMSDVEYLLVREIRDEIRKLYWIKNDEVSVKFDKGKIIVKYPYKDEKVYEVGSEWI